MYIDGWAKDVVVFDSELWDDEIAHRAATALAGLDQECVTIDVYRTVEVRESTSILQFTSIKLIRRF